MKRFMCLFDINVNGQVLFAKGKSYTSIPGEDESQQFIEAESGFLMPASGKTFVQASKQNVEKYFREV